MKKLSSKLLISSILSILLLAGISAIFAGEQTGFVTINENSFLEKMSALFARSTSTPTERVYVQTDKPLYAPGETIWFQAYVMNTVNLKASENSDIIHVQLINPKGGVEKEMKIIASDGSAGGDFSLGTGIAGGLYKLKAYTQWQNNDKDALIFEKELQVQQVILPRIKMKLDYERKAYGPGDEVQATVNFASLENKPMGNKEITWILNIDGQKYNTGKGKTNANGLVIVKVKLPADLKTTDGLLGVLIDHEGNTESISRSVPIVLNKISLSFFPEGGDMVANLDSRVAFRARNEFNKGADIEGDLMDDLDHKISSFSSYHSGMGSFNLTPLPGRQYYVKITKPAGIDTQYPVPPALIAGFTMKIQKSKKKDEMVMVVNSTLKGELSLIATVRDKIYFRGAFDAVPGENKINIPLDRFPMGVAKFTLFDSKGIPQAERLVFTNKEKQMKISLTTNKEKYQPREKVKMTIKTTDESGSPISANLSMAVVDDKLLSFSDDRTGTILSRLFLEPELKDKIEESAFYFDPKEPKADSALDFLLLTSGWRHFTWKQISDGVNMTASYPGEKAEIKGIVTDMETARPLSHKKVELTSSDLKLFTYTDQNGAYTFRLNEMTDPVTISVTDPLYVYYAASVSEFQNNFNIPMTSIEYQKKQAHLQKYYNMKFKNMPREMMMREDKEVFMAPNMNGGAVYTFSAANKRLLSKPGPDLHHSPVIVKEDDIVQIKGKINADSTIENRKDVKINYSYYYKAREFPAPVYAENSNKGARSDFRSTIFWNGNVETDAAGNAELSFFNSDDITSFRATAEGLGDGLAGHAETVFYTRLPFSISAKIPLNASAGDKVKIPVNLTNNTGNLISGSLSFTAPRAWLSQETSWRDSKQDISIGPHETKTMFLDFNVQNMPGNDSIKIQFISAGQRDEIVQEVNTSEKGFPEEISFSGEEKDKTYAFDIGNPVSGTLHAEIDAYPGSLSETMKGLDAILREPNGCFEQTSSSNYPNIIALMYMKETGEINASVKTRALDLLDRGYKKLISFETSQQGYEWFGSTPAHEALTAYGLMEFNDMKGVYPGTDQSMIDRTANWLMNRKDHSGGFKRDGKALDAFGRASDAVTNAYIVYALSEAGYTNLSAEIDAAVEKAGKSCDAYQLGLVANALQDLNDPRADKFIKLLTGMQKADGSWEGMQSITMSGGKGLKVETTSLVVMGLMKNKNVGQKALDDGIKFIIGSRDGNGGFGSTQTTVLALKALTRYSKYSKHTKEAGDLVLYIDNKQVAMQHYAAGEKNEIKITGIDQYLSAGKHNFRILYKNTKYPLPYSVSIHWRNTAHGTDELCPVKLSTVLSATTVKTGETIRFTSVLKNASHDGQPSTIVILGIPAGLSAQPWQLKELQEKEVYDYYEIKENKVILYYRQMKPDEIKTIHLDLKAEIPGSYEAPASCAYLYYTSENKSWCKAGNVVIGY